MALNIIEIPPGRAAKSGALARGADDTRPSVKRPIPDSLGFTEHAAAALRRFLADKGLDGYHVFYNYVADVELGDVDEHLESLGGHGGWQALPPLAGGSAGLTSVRVDRDGVVSARMPGCIHLHRYEIVLARWFWVNATEDAPVEAWLCAAASFENYVRLRDELRRLRHARWAGEWRVVSGCGPGERVPRGDVAAPCGDNLMLSDALRQRIDAEVVRFFSDEAAALYASMGVPYRRGVLMHGPPGNGKTSLIRHIGQRVRHVPGFILRASADFDSDDLTAVIRRWTIQAPSILVIEDLDSLLEEVDVSTFLNLIDGVESAATGGLLLIATTNHPDKLDPAINNRPGRFDVVIEVPPPDEPTRFAYLRRQLPGADETLLRRVASDSEGLAFAHLQEIVRLSGLLAINAGRASRTCDDIQNAARTVRDAYDEAVRGFPPRPEVPFGLVHLQKLRQKQE